VNNKTARLPQSAVPVIHYWHGSSRNALFRHVEAVKEDEIRLWFIHLFRLTSSSSVQSVGGKRNKTATDCPSRPFLSFTAGEGAGAATAEAM